MIIQISTFLIISCFYLTYFLKQHILRKQDIMTNRLAKGKKPKKTKIIEVVLLLATYGMAIIQYVSIFFSVDLFPFNFPIIVRWLGIILSLIGFLAFLSAIVVMRDSWRAGIDESQSTTLVTRGIYKYSRNPAFVGFDLLYIGSLFSTPNLLLTMFSIVTIILIHLQILQEEKFLLKTFDKNYLDYKENTVRYLFF